MHSFTSSLAAARVRWLDLPGHGEPVVFIHGLGCASTWEYPRIVTDPAFGGRRAILIDLPGYGYSERPELWDYRTRSQAQVVAELLKAIGLTRFDLYGHSMGGSIAIEVASLLPSRVQTLAVSEPNFHSGGGMFSREIVRQSETEFVKSGYSKMLREEPSPWAASLQNSAPWALWRGAKSLVEGIEPSWMSLFLALSCNKALIFGDLSLPDGDVDSLRAAGVPVHIVPDAGHSMSWENPTALAGILMQIFGGESH